MTWQKTEDEVRRIASYIWNRPATTQMIAGVKCDCVLELDSDSLIIIEITEQASLEKVREDIIKLRAVRSALLAEEKYSKCYFVMQDKPTDSMRATGKTNKIEVLSINEFRNLYFDFSSYVYRRRQQSFGSLIDSITGKPEENKYIRVAYIDVHTGKQYDIDEIINCLKNGRKIILKGDFGVGKSRCIKQLFETICNQDDFYNAIAINLREYWGLKHCTEVLNRHFFELGLDSQNLMKSYTNPNIIYLLDGFDEIGTQIWTTDAQKMRHTKEVSVLALKELLTKVDGGVLLTGREYYFNSDEEMLTSLGLDQKHSLILECRNEFTDKEIYEFLKENCTDIEEKEIKLPEWLPKRPFIMQLVLKCAPELVYTEYTADDLWDFWCEFLHRLCEREAKINAILNPDTIRQILILLARKTRTKKNDLGPLTLKDLSDAFEAVVGMPPSDESSIMLQRLPGIGRIEADSPDRQFLDVFILNGLRAENIIQIQENNLREVLDENWDNPMDLHGCTILSAYIQREPKREGYFINLAIQASKFRNSIIVADIVSSIALNETQDVLDYKNIHIKDSHFKNLLWTGKQIINLSIEDTIIENLDITNASITDKVSIKDCLINSVMGISSEKGIPTQFSGCQVEKFEAIGTMSRIKKAKLSNQQKIFVAIIKKIFFQPGRGRKEETLTRGFGDTESKRYAEKIINKLLSEKIIVRHKGDEGYVYKPVRDYSSRMDAILTQLTTSEDELWDYVSKLR